ncbi:MAG: DUF975 family protein [Oscillospiraceae bacterium]|nr:DUF975 family protein [Oscillospiraceae bacterium]
MGFPNSKNIIAASRAALSRARYSPTRLAFYYIGLPTALNLLLMVVSHVLSQQDAGSGGLSGLGTQAALESTDLLLRLALSVFTMFWQMGYIRAVLRWARGEDAAPADLFEGLRNFGPVLRSFLLQGVLVFVIAMVAVQLSAIVYIVSPLSESFAAVVEQMMADPTYVPDSAFIMNFYLSYGPFLLLAVAILGLPVAYRLRLVEFALMDTPREGAFYALRMSLALMRGNCVKLFKLDLRFWWFYALQGLTSVIFYLDLILELLGVQTGIDGNVLFYLCSILGLLAQLLLLTFGANRIYTAYAVVYETLKPKEEQPPQQMQY